MSRRLMIVPVALVLAVQASAQTASELAKRYAHHEVYEIQPGVQMSAKFASSGSVCEMQIEQAHFGTDGVDMRDGIDKERIHGLTEQLVPSSERGKIDDKPPSGMVIEITDRRLAGESTVKIWREYRDITQEKLAKAFKVSRAMIAAIESGRKTGGITTLRKLAGALDVDLENLA